MNATSNATMTGARSNLVALARKAGLWAVRVEEIEGGCSLARCRSIFVANAVDAIGHPGTVILSDPFAVAEAIELLDSLRDPADGRWTI